MLMAFAGRPKTADSASADVAGPRPLASPIAGAVRVLNEVYALIRDPEPHGRPIEAAGEADLVEARLMADHWQGRAEAAEARLVALEARLATAEMTALELRSRVVCLHGKLATTTATVRYQTMTLALESQAPPTAPDLEQD